MTAVNRLQVARVLAAAVLSSAQIRAPFKFDPTKVCSSCAEWNAHVEPICVFESTRRRCATPSTAGSRRSR